MALETLKSSCSHYDGRRLWLGKAALRSRLVDVRGWRGGRRLRDSILLDEVESVARSSNKGGGNLVFAMKDGSERSLRVSAPGIWRMQIDYRLRRIAGLTAAEPQDAHLVPAITLDQSLPTADEVEHPLPIEDGEAQGDLGSELAAWPRFETEEATIEIVEGADLEPEFLIEPVAVSDDGILVPTEPDLDLMADSEVEEHEEVALVDALSFEIEADEREEEHQSSETVLAEAAEARALDIPAPEDLHEIGDDVVSDLAMDATTHEDVVMGWLSPMESEVLAETSAAGDDEDEAAFAHDDLQADDDAEPLMADIEEELEAEAPLVEIKAAEDEIEVVLDAPSTEMEAALQLEPTAAELELDAKPLIAEIEVEAPDLGVDAGLEVEAPDLVMESGLDVEDPVVPIAEAPESEIVLEPDPEPEVVPEVEASIEADADADAEPKPRLGIAARPFELSRLYEAAPEPTEAAAEPTEAAAEPIEAAPEPTEAAAEPTEAAAEPELAEAAPAQELAQPEPEISLEPVTKRERRRRQSMADLRPMSLAELIRQSEPRWTRLAEMD